jgi:arsenate reductase-like glutaredoxin family protein
MGSRRNRDPLTIDPSLYFQSQSVNKPTAQRTNNSHIKLIFDHQNSTCRRVLHFLRDNGVEPDLIHYRYSPLTRRELTGLLKAIPLKDLEHFVQLKSPRYQQRPFTISQTHHEQTINHILPYQSELLTAPIVYNVLTHAATIIPPLPQTPVNNTALDGLNKNSSPKNNTLNVNDFNPVIDPELTAQVASQFEKILPVISRDSIGANKLWDDGPDLFPIPQRFEHNRNPQKVWERDMYNDREKKQNATAPKLSKDPFERSKQVDELVDRQAEQFKGLFNQLSPQKGQNNVRYDPKTGKPTPESLGFAKREFDYPGDQMRIQPQLVKSEQINRVMYSKEQWIKKQEKEFGKLDKNEFEKWKRTRAEKNKIEDSWSR